VLLSGSYILAWSDLVLRRSLVSDLFTEEVMEARSRFICCIFVTWWVSILLYFTLHRSFFSLATFPWPLDRIVLSFISLIHVVGWFLHPCVARSRGPQRSLASVYVFEGIYTSVVLPFLCWSNMDMRWICYRGS
jgi:hypothetical protein